jgi:hypothetical protein
MLSENEDVISFYPGSIKKGQVTLGRIVVHDRLNVEADVLPRYFNHSSFASLRRQLNYFSFTRMGKGRQRGATYCNDAVVEREDILRLKRRSAVGTHRESQTQEHRPTPEQLSGKRERAVSVSSSSDDNNNLNTDTSTKRRPQKKYRYTTTTKYTTPPKIVSPRSSPVHRYDEVVPQITLDLTVPSHAGASRGHWNHHLYAPTLTHGDSDILAGCKALLCFSKGLHFNNGGEIGSAV